jgi:hypothetical protein
MLDEEAQTEEHGEYRIHLSGKKEEDCIPDTLIHSTPERTGRFRKHIEVQLFDKMNKYDASYGYTSKDIGHINSRVR